MKVNIVTEGNRIKRRLSEKIKAYNPFADIEYDLTESPASGPASGVDANLYVCYNLFDQKSSTKDVGYVTHIHKSSIGEHEKETHRSFLRFLEMDALVHMNSTTMQVFENLGYKKIQRVSGAGIEVKKFKPHTTVGIVQNGEVDGKGLQFMCDLVDGMDPFLKGNLFFVIQGVGWERLVEKFNSCGIPYEYRNSLDYTQYPEVYKKIDYLLIPSLWEGGPIAYLEAAVCDVEVIAADVGFVSSFHSDESRRNNRYFSPGDINALLKILRDKTKYFYSCECFSKSIGETIKRVCET